MDQVDPSFLVDPIESSPENPGEFSIHLEDAEGSPGPRGAVAVILAAGRGSRLVPYTDALPTVGEVGETTCLGGRLVRILLVPVVGL